MWEEIAKDIQEKGHGYSGAQCETKLKNLKQNFIKTVDHNNKSGSDKKTCPYFEEHSDIFDLTPAVKPVAVCSNRAGTFGADLIIASSSSQSRESVASSIAAEKSLSDTELTQRIYFIYFKMLKIVC